jgi:uncharacterized protein YkwD
MRRVTRRLTGALAASLAMPVGLALNSSTAWAQEAPVEVQALGAEPAPEGALPEGPPAISELELLVLALVNGARMARELHPLVWDETMSVVARAHAADMMQRGVVSHTGSDGSSPRERLRRAGVEFRFGSENIWTYWGKTPAEGPRTMHLAMMAEPHAPGLWNHIGNILYAGYYRIGVGIAVAPSGVQYLSEKFAD